MTCHNKCSHEQEILDRLANIENKDLHTVQTVNGVYGPFITLDFPDVQQVKGVMVFEELGYKNIEYSDNLIITFGYRNVRSININYKYFTINDDNYESLTIPISDINGVYEISNILCKIEVTTNETEIQLKFLIENDYKLEIKTLLINKITDVI